MILTDVGAQQSGRSAANSEGARDARRAVKPAWPAFGGWIVELDGCVFDDWMGVLPEVQNVGRELIWSDDAVDQTLLKDRYEVAGIQFA